MKTIRQNVFQSVSVLEGEEKFWSRCFAVMSSLMENTLCCSVIRLFAGSQWARGGDCTQLPAAGGVGGRGGGGRHR